MNTLNEIREDTPRSVLWIGGIADGQRSTDPETPCHWLMSPSADAKSLYRREHICAGRDKIVIYVFSALTMSQAIDKLIRGYSVTS